MTQPYDIAIVGGGLVGLGAALVLQHPDRRVCVVEAADFEAPLEGGLNARSIASSKGGSSMRSPSSAPGAQPVMKTVSALTTADGFTCHVSPRVHQSFSPVFRT